MKETLKVLKYLKYDIKNTIIAFILLILECVFELLIPFFMKDIINKGIMQNDIYIIIKIGIIIIACSIIALALGYLYSIHSARAISSFSYHLRLDIFKKIQTYSFANLDNFESSSLITRATSDVQILQGTLAGGIRPITRAPMMIILGVVLAFLIEPSLAWVFLVAIPFLGLIMLLIVKYTSKKYIKLQQNIDRLNLDVRENATAIRTVKAYVREDYENKKFSQSNENVFDTTKRTIRISSLNQPAFQFTMYGVTIALLWLGSTLVHNNKIEIGSLSALLSYVLQIVNSIMMLSNVFILLNRSIASSARINEVLDEKPTIKSLGNNAVQKGNIEFKNVSFKYNEKSLEYVLKNISFNIPNGKSVGIIGSTGSSKSTLVSLMLRLYDVSEGEILIDNVDIKEYDLVNLRDNISIVLQNNILFSGSIRENLLWGNKEASDDEIIEALRMSNALEFVEKIGLDYDLGQGGVNVSGGQRQRLCIARALLKKPKIIIFDDSTSACDMETERNILKELKKLKNMTSIIIGQRISAIKDLDMIIVLDNGKISSMGSHDELIKKSKIYKEICDAQLGGDENVSSN